MNSVILSGRICTIPKIKLLQIEGKSVSMCVFTIAVAEMRCEFDNTDSGKNRYDYFECVAFENAARLINSNFVKGSKIVCRGKMRNHIFADANQTKHFTQVFIIEQAEYGDTETVFDKNNSKKKSLELVIAADMKEISELYCKICENGFLCIDEEDYYRIAMSNI